MTSCKSIEQCLACGGTDLELVLDLNDQPLANAFLEHQHEPEPVFPLAVNLCKHCCHLQLTHAVDPKLIYTHYLYVSGTSQTQHSYMSWFAKFASEYFNGQPSSVLDIGCNDGTQLNYFKELGVETYGIDPAQNLFATSSQQHHVVCDFFNASTAKLFVEKYGQVDCVVAQNSFAHNPDPLGYLIALKDIIAEHGLFFIQTSQADMVLNNEFDTIYHEHVNFYNINSMKALCDRAGYNLVDVIKTPIHGTSYVFVLSPGIARPSRIANLLELERLAGLENINTYHKWAKNVMSVVGQFYSLCQVFKHQQGYKLVGYGAAAKGNTLLNFAQLDLDMIVDDNPLKQGLLSPGRHIPVVGIEALDAISENQPVMFVPLAWNFYSEIREKILAKRSVEQDRFIKYFPEVRVE